MPLFFFHVYADGNLVEDLEGSELPDLAAAHSEAHASARDLLSELIKAERVLDGQSIEIADVTGRIVASVPLRSAVLQR